MWAEISLIQGTLRFGATQGHNQDAPALEYVADIPSPAGY